MPHPSHRQRRATLSEEESVNFITQLLTSSSHVRDAMFFVPGRHHPQNPYSLMQTLDRAHCRGEHWMLYPGGFLHVRADGNSDRLNLWDWVRDARVFSQLARIDFFRTMRVRKAFSLWLRTARANRFERRRRHLAKALRFQEPYLALLTDGLGELRGALDQLQPLPTGLSETTFVGHALVAACQTLADVCARQAYVAVHALLERLHMLCFQLVSDLARAWQRLRRERCPSTYDSPVLGTARGRVARLRDRVSRCEKLEAMLPAFTRLLAGLVRCHVDASMSTVLTPVRRHFTYHHQAMIQLQLEIATEVSEGGGDDVNHGTSMQGNLRPAPGDEKPGPPAAQLRVVPSRALLEAQLRQVSRLATYSVKLGAECALKPLLESWACHQPPTFQSSTPAERIRANEVRFVHWMRDDSWSSVEYQIQLVGHLTAPVARDFTMINTFLEQHDWIVVLFNYCRTMGGCPVKPVERLAGTMAELKQLVDWDRKVQCMVGVFNAQLLQLNMVDTIRQLEEIVHQRAMLLSEYVVSVVGEMNADMRKMIREIPGEFGVDEIMELSRWYHLVMDLIRNPYQKFEVVGTINRFKAFLEHAGWHEPEWKAKLLSQVTNAAEELNAEWTCYLDTIYSKHLALLDCLNQRRPSARDQYQQALQAVDALHEQFNILPRWFGASDVIMKALIPGFNVHMAERLTERITTLFDDVDLLEELLQRMHAAMEETQEAERLIQIIFHETAESQHVHGTYIKIQAKVALWAALRDLLAIARVWLTDMRNSDLRHALRSGLNAWQEQRRHFLSDIGSERQLMRFWRDRMDEVRRLVVMMEAMQGDSDQGGEWSAVVGKMRYILADKERNEKESKHEATIEDAALPDLGGGAGSPKETEEETLTKHVSVIDAQVSLEEKNFTAKELVDSMNARLAKIEFTMQRYIPQYILDQGMLMAEEVYIVTDGIPLEAEVMSRVSALSTVMEWNIANSWWREVLATNECWEGAGLIVRRLMAVQRDWVRLHHLAYVGVAPQLPPLILLTTKYCALTRILKHQPRLLAHNFSDLLGQLREMEQHLTEYFSAAGNNLEEEVRRHNRTPSVTEGERAPTILAGDMERQLLIQAEEEGLVLHSCQVESLLAIHQALTANRIVIVAGEPGTGKSTMIHLLLSAKQQILGGSVDEMYSVGNTARIIARAVVGPRPLDQVIASARMMGTLPSVEEWLVLDHDWQRLDELVQRVSPVVSQNGSLLLVVETCRLDDLGPAEQCMPCVSLARHKLSWRMLVRAWLGQVAKTALYRGELETLNHLSELLFPSIISFLSRHHTTLGRACNAEELVSGYFGCHHVNMFRRLFTTLMAGYDSLLIRHGDASRVVPRVMALAFVWAFGGALEQRHRSAFEAEARRLMVATPELDFPSDGAVYDHTLDSEARWRRWSDVAGRHVSTIDRQWHVRVPQQASIASLIVKLLRHNINVLLYGRRGSGKSQVLRHEVAPSFQAVSLDHAPYTDADTARHYLASLCRRIRVAIPRPAIVIDDLHYATNGHPDGLQHLVREHMQSGGFRVGQDFEFSSNGALPVCATAVDAPTTVGRQEGCASLSVGARLRHRSFVLVLPETDAALIAAVFGPIVQRSVAKYLPAGIAAHSALFIDTWVGATCRLYAWLRTKLRANAVHPGRAFNLHHVSRCMSLALESACRLLDSTRIKGTQQERVHYILPEVWYYAVDVVFQQRLDCAKDREKFSEEAGAIAASLRERFDVGDVSICEKSSITGSPDRSSDHETPVDKRSCPSVCLSKRLRHSNSRSQNRYRTKQSKERESHRGSKTRTNSNSNRASSHGNGKSHNRNGKRGMSKKMSERGSIEMRPNIVHGTGKSTYSGSVNSPHHKSGRKGSRHHYHQDTFISKRRREINEERHGRHSYHRPISRYLKLDLLNKGIKSLNSAGKDEERCPGTLNDGLQHETSQLSNGADRIARLNKSRVRLILASSVIMDQLNQRLASTNVEMLSSAEIPDSFPGLLEHIVKQFAVAHPDRLPGALPTAMTNLLLTMVQSLSTSCRCTTILRDCRTAGLRTITQLACFVTGHRFVDLRSHAIAPDELVPELSRCVLRALFEGCNQCIYVAGSSQALGLVHSVVASRLPVQLVYGHVWRLEAKRMGVLDRLKYLEDRGMLLTVAGNCISRHLHVIVTCTISGDDGCSHFPSLHIQTQWPALFDYSVICLPDWPTENYVQLAQHYIGSMDAGLDAPFVPNALVKLHLATSHSRRQIINSLSFLYQLCEAFVIYYHEIKDDLTKKLGQTITHLRELHAAKTLSNLAAEEVSELAEIVTQVKEKYAELNTLSVDLHKQIADSRDHMYEIEKRQANVAYQLHMKHLWLDDTKPKVDDLHLKMSTISDVVDFQEIIAHMIRFTEAPESVRSLSACLTALFDKEPSWESAMQLFRIEGFAHVLALMSFDIMSEENIMELGNYLPANGSEQTVELLQSECPVAVPLLQWLQQLVLCARVHLDFMSGVVESSRLSEEFFSLQLTIDSAHAELDVLVEKRELILKRRRMAGDEADELKLHLAHARSRHDWLARLVSYVWRTGSCSEGSRAVGHRLCDDFVRLYDALRHLPAHAAIMAAASTFSGWQGTDDSVLLQLWLEQLACSQPQACQCEAVTLPFPQLVSRQVEHLPDRLREHVETVLPKFCPHPLETDVGKFLQRAVIPSSFCPAEVAFFQRQRGYGDNHALYARVLLAMALQRKTCQILLVSDPERKLHSFLGDMNITMPTMTEDCLLSRNVDVAQVSTNATSREESIEGMYNQKGDQFRVIAGAQGSHRDSSLGEHPTMTWSGLHVLSHENFGTKQVTEQNKRTVENSVQLNPRKPVQYPDTTLVVVDDPTAIDISSVLQFVKTLRRRLLICYHGHAVSMAERLLSANHGIQHTVTHIDLSMAVESISGLVSDVVARRLRPEVHSNERTYQDDLCYWLGRSTVSEHELLDEWPELLGLLRSLQPSVRRSFGSLVPRATVPDQVTEPQAAAPRLQHHARRRPTLTLPAVRVRDDATTLTTRFSLSPELVGSESGSDLLSMLNRRRRSTSASLDRARHWRERVGLALQPVLSRRSVDSTADPCVLTMPVEENSGDNVLSDTTEEHRYVSAINISHKCVELTESALSCPLLEENERSEGSQEADSEIVRPHIGGKINHQSGIARPPKISSKVKCRRPTIKKHIPRTAPSTSAASIHDDAKLLEEPALIARSKLHRRLGFSFGPVLPSFSVAVPEGYPNTNDLGGRSRERQSSSESVKHSDSQSSDTSNICSVQDRAGSVKPLFRGKINRVRMASCKNRGSVNSTLPGKTSRLRSGAHHSAEPVRRKSRPSRRARSVSPSRHHRVSEDLSPTLRRKRSQPLQPLNAIELARCLLLSLNARGSAFQKLVAEVDTLDSRVVSCRSLLAEVAEQKLPLAPVSAFFTGLYSVVSSLHLQNDRLTLDIFCAWLGVSLRARATATIEDRKSIDYFCLLGGSDVLPRLLERVPTGVHFWYLVLAALASSGWTEPARLRLLVRGPPPAHGWRDDWLSACPDWVAEREWLSLGALACHLSPIRHLVAALHRGDDRGWKERLQAGPDVLDRDGLDVEEWALVWRVLRPDTVLDVVRQLVNFALGPATLQGLDELPDGDAGAQLLVQHLGECVPAPPCAGMPLLMMEKLYSYVDELLALLRREHRRAMVSVPPSSDRRADLWSNFIASEMRVARAHLQRAHDDLSDVRRLLTARLGPTRRLDELVAALSHRSIPAGWTPPGGAPSQHVAHLLRHLLAGVRHLQELEHQAAVNDDLTASPIQLRLGQLFTPTRYLPSLRLAAAAQLHVPAERVAVTVLDDQHPEPCRSVRVLLDTRGLSLALKRHLGDLCAGWRRRPRTERIELAVCPIGELSEAAVRAVRGDIGELSEAAPPAAGPKQTVGRAGSNLDPKMKQYVEQVRLSVGSRGVSVG